MKDIIEFDSMKLRDWMLLAPSRFLTLNDYEVEIGETFFVSNAITEHSPEWFKNIPFVNVNKIVVVIKIVDIVECSENRDDWTVIYENYCYDGTSTTDSKTVASFEKLVNVNKLLIPFWFQEEGSK